jgi:hypothetical protein
MKEQPQIQIGHNYFETFFVSVTCLALRAHVVCLSPLLSSYLRIDLRVD